MATIRLIPSAYCREHQLSPFSLSYYKRKFAGALLPVKAQPKKSEFVTVQFADVPPEPAPLTLHFANGAHLSGITANNVIVVKQLAEALA